MNTLLEFKNLTKIYDSTCVAVKDLTLSLPKGKIIGLLGPNGSGKTTLIKMITGLLQPTSGEILIRGKAPGPETKACISYLPDCTYLNNNTSIRKLAAFFRDFYKDFSMEKALGMLETLNISPDARMKSLSKGTKEKVQIILTMSRNASLYVLDEPIAGVDPAARDFILKTILQNYNPEATILISTHLISDIESILDEVIFLKYGQLVLYNTTDYIREQYGKSVDAYFREVFSC